ncbi:uncharacterized protein PHACADRAFT_183854, partial [Phanerochaete carnosa HHB-10118-sp]
MSRRIQGVSNAQYGQGAIAQAAHDEHLVWVDQSGTSNVSNVKYANHTPAAGFQCKQCHSRFISQEMTVLHEQMEHAKTLLRYRSIGVRDNPIIVHGKPSHTAYAPSSLQSSVPADPGYKALDRFVYTRCVYSVL